ncbi:ABC transporter permease [Anaerolentibacter hominis]|uniref:ABC transporter permease n=1 Tax=Anaerolentibacter hominis TaxID=3079009 RepID=UPI0031B83A7E
MRAIRISFIQMLVQMRKDFMLFVMPVIPFLAGVLFRFAVPFAERKLTGYFSVPGIIAPYYPLIDAALTLMTPVLIQFTAALIMLEEADDGIIRYLSVTPLGKKGYVISRLVIPTACTIPLNLLVSALFHIEGFGPLNTILLCTAGSIYGCVIALMIVTLSSNRVEGMAVGKMTSLLTIGLAAPFFIHSPAQYLFAVTPAFWVAKFVLEGHMIDLIVCVLISAIWAAALFRRYIRKNIQ